MLLRHGARAIIPSTQLSSWNVQVYRYSSGLFATYFQLLPASIDFESSAPSTAVTVWLHHDTGQPRLSREMVCSDAFVKVHRVPCVLDEAAMRGRPKATLVLTETERDELLALARRRKTAQAYRRHHRPIDTTAMRHETDFCPT